MKTNKNKFIHVRVNPDLLSFIKKRAKYFKMSVSEFLRGAAVEWRPVRVGRAPHILKHGTESLDSLRIKNSLPNETPEDGVA